MIFGWKTSYEKLLEARVAELNAERKALLNSLLARYGAPPLDLTSPTPGETGAPPKPGKGKPLPSKLRRLYEQATRRGHVEARPS